MLGGACSNVHIGTLVFIGIPIYVLELLSLLWLDKLRKEHTLCACSENWRRTYLYVYIAIALVVSIMYQVYRIYRGCDVLITKPWLVGYSIFAIFHIGFIVLSFQYLRMLKNKNCQCALKDHGDNMLQILTYAKVVVLGLGFVLAVLLPYIIIVAVLWLAGSKIKNVTK